MSKVSIVIPAYNCADQITDALNSILEQTYKNYEIIVVDDGSSDSIENVIKSFNAPITFLRQSNGGAAVARNTGMKHARGKYIAFLDADDIWLPEKLQTQISFLKENHNVGFVCSDGFRWLPPDPPASGKRLSFLRGRPPKNLDLSYMFKIHLINTSSVLFRRDLLDSVGYMNKILKHGQDFEFFLRLAAQAPAVYIHLPLMAYRVHPKNTSSFITHENVRRRIQNHLFQREVALSSLPQLQDNMNIKTYARSSALLKYSMVFGWRLRYGGSWKYLMSCLINVGRKFLP